jgi:Raf kinase inhibitor-like YbhB/YbcL family protein
MKTRSILWVIVGLGWLGLAACRPATQLSTQGVASMSLSSSAFSAGQAIPADYTCKGADASPPLEWSDAPQDTRSFVLIMDDPDAMGWVHWVVYDLPAATTGLPEASREDTLAEGAAMGKNSWGNTAYGGPCPPIGSHHYSFRIYAADTLLDLSGEADKSAAEKALQGHILAQAELIGVYPGK